MEVGDQPVSKLKPFIYDNVPKYVSQEEVVLCSVPIVNTNHQIM